jgi:uncharacterized membrane-anchored protein
MPMQSIHLPILGPRYWVALCIASIFVANMGDFFARNIGLGHVAGLPFLAAALAILVFAERSTASRTKPITGSRSSSCEPRRPISRISPAAI